MDWNADKKIRGSNIELLRVFAMLMITFNHIGSIGEVATAIDTLPVNTALAIFYEGGANLGLISSQ